MNILLAKPITGFTLSNKHSHKNTRIFSYGLCKPVPVIKTDAPELFFVSIIPNFAGNEEYTAELISGCFVRSGITRYALSYPLHQQGQDVYDKARIQAASFRKLKALLKDLPIQPGILLQSTIGHGGYWNPAPDCSLTGEYTTKADGSKTIRFCPYEPNFLEYIYNATKIVVAEGPAFLMGDDDMRMSDDSCP